MRLEVGGRIKKIKNGVIEKFDLKEISLVRDDGNQNNKKKMGRPGKGKVKKKTETTIRYPIDEENKQRLRDRLEEVMSQKDGCQVIILWDKNRLSDYYQNICGHCLLEHIEESAREYERQTDGRLIAFNPNDK